MVLGASEHQMRTEEEIKRALQNLENKVLETNDERAKNIITAKIYSLKWVLNQAD